MHKHQTMIRSFLLAIAFFFSAQVHAQSDFRIGATAVPGLLAPAEAQNDIVLERILIHFKGFRYIKNDHGRYDAFARFSVHYSFLNKSKKKVFAEATVPNRVYFNEFDRRQRSLILDNVAAAVPGLFRLQGNEQQIREEMEALFSKKVFIRRFMNVRDLPKLDMAYAIVQDGRALHYERCELEFRWNKDRPEDPGVLQMEVKQKLQLVFPADSRSELEWEFLSPAFLTGKESTKLYVPVSTTGIAGWGDKVKRLYLASSANDGSVALPYYMDYKQAMMDHDINLVIIENHKPQRNERIAFYDVKDIGCACYEGDARAVPVYIPQAIDKISASSWYQNEIRLNGDCLQSEEEVSIYTNVPPYLNGLDGTLGFTGRALKKVHHTRVLLDGKYTADCDDSGEPYLRLDQGYHPVWAFDESSDSIETDGQARANTFSTTTAWCAAGGVGEYLEFETRQSVKEIKFYTGIRSNNDIYRKFGRVKMLQIEQTDGPYRKLIVLSDLVTSSYEVMMPAGKYRMTIKETYPGVRYESTCLARLRFTFASPDPWLDQIIKKPGQ